MNYIGSKLKLSSWIKDVVCEVCGDDLSDKIFCDLFAGTGIIGRIFRPLVKKIIANDIEYYSFVLNKNYIQNCFDFTRQSELIDTLNALKIVPNGFIFSNYSQGSKCGRQYFSNHNGQKIDAIRQKIEEWKNSGKIDEKIYFFLLASLLESADKVANTASMYGAFLKHLKPSAKKDLILSPAIFASNQNENEVYNEDANELIKKISGDILYLDPPYNARQYGANYHLLNTIARYDIFTPRGATGLRKYEKSKYCKKNEVLKKFEELIQNANFKYIFLSYNDEGLMSEKDIAFVMKKHGSYALKTKAYKRFKADNKRICKQDKTIECLHILKKNCLILS